MKSRVLRQCVQIAFLSSLIGFAQDARAQGSLGGLTLWAEESKEVLAQWRTGAPLPTNAFAQLIVSATTTAAPPLHFGSAQGIASNWYILDTAKVPRPGRIIGYHPQGGSNALYCTVRVLMPNGPYAGDRFRIPNPTPSNGLWIAQTTPKPWTGSFYFHIDASLWTNVTLDPNQDTDGDGMTDAVEWRHFNDPVAETPAGDADGDGVNNVDELLTVTDPTNAQSFLRIDAWPDDEAVTLSWFAQTGLVYGVERSVGGPGDGMFEPIVGPVSVESAGLVATNLPRLEAAATYRLVAAPPP
jgi:hypothetical protein